jgi:hypothetical protein
MRKMVKSRNDDLLRELEKSRQAIIGARWGADQMEILKAKAHGHLAAAMSRRDNLETELRNLTGDDHRPIGEIIKAYEPVR